MDQIAVSDVVALLVDQPHAHLQRGDVGTVIQVFKSFSDHPAGLIVEFVDEFGQVKVQIDITDQNQIVKLRYRPAIVE
jgi:Domain of unknown function (DUF4926)